MPPGKRAAVERESLEVVADLAWREPPQTEQRRHDERHKHEQQERARDTTGEPRLLGKRRIDLQRGLARGFGERQRHHERREHGQQPRARLGEHIGRP